MTAGMATRGMMAAAERVMSAAAEALWSFRGFVLRCFEALSFEVRLVAEAVGVVVSAEEVESAGVGRLAGAIEALVHIG